MSDVTPVDTPNTPKHWSHDRLQISNYEGSYEVGIYPVQLSDITPLPHRLVNMSVMHCTVMSDEVPPKSY